MRTSNRVLIIGLDGATWDVLDPWIEDGTLPHLARLRRAGSWGPLASTLPPLTAPAWSTFLTGKRPAKHGVFHFIDLFDDDRGSRPDIVNSRSLKSSTLWDIAGHHGRRLITINTPMSYPPRPVNGVMITCFLTPRNAPVFTYPPELSQELAGYIIDLDRFIDVKPFQGPRDNQVVAPTLQMVREFREMTDVRAAIALRLMQSEPWDVFMVVFTSTDRMGHYLWPYHRSPDPNDDPNIQALCRAVREHYARLDEIVSELAAASGEDTTLVIMSDHGMGKRAAKRVHVNNWLRQRGWLVPVSSNANGASGAADLLQRLGLPRDKVGRIIRRIPGLMKTKVVKKAAQSRPLEVDTRRSQAYCMSMFDTVGGIQINLEGEAKEALRRQIVDGLQHIVDPETGEQVVDRIYYGPDYYDGPFAGHAPDIAVSMKPDYACNIRLGYYSAPVTPITSPLPRGNHRMNGIFLASGPDVVANPEPLKNLAIEDVAPTVLHLMGLPVPSDMDGRAITEILSPARQAAQSVQRSAPIGFWPSETEAVYRQDDLSEEDEDVVRQRLQALGYLD